MYNIKVTVTVEELGGGLEVCIPVENPEGAVEVAAKYLLLNHCGWKEALVKGEYETSTLAKEGASLTKLQP